MDKQPFISVIVPVYNGSKYLNRCLDALIASSYKPFEIVVIDDASTDDSAGISGKSGVTVLRLSHRSGPAAARNYGAQKARGDILFFVDSDIMVQRDTIAQVAADLMENPHISAVFGSYDDSPDATDFLSQFRNLFHHFIHQHSHEEAKTFWAGCGAIYREVFYLFEGFDEHRFPKPSIEDIELGFRMWKSGYRILLDKELKVKHLKRWEWHSWLKTDIFWRAVPWSQLILESGFLPRDLNLQISHRISAILVSLLILMILIAFSDVFFFGITTGGLFFMVSVLLIAILLFLNRELYTFFLEKRGVKFMTYTIPVHFLYYFYSGSSFVICWILHKLDRLRWSLRKILAQL
jgi:glycosyltransferase involved in cell wall biosynthesis